MTANVKKQKKEILKLTVIAQKVIRMHTTNIAPISHLALVWLSQNGVVQQIWLIIACFL